MRKFRLLNGEDYSEEYFKTGKVYPGYYCSPDAPNASVYDLAKYFPKDWEEVLGEEDTQSAPTKEDRIEFMGQFMRQFDISFGDLSEHL